MPGWGLALLIIILLAAMLAIIIWDNGGAEFARYLARRHPLGFSALGTGTFLTLLIAGMYVRFGSEAFSALSLSRALVGAMLATFIVAFVLWLGGRR